MKSAVLAATMGGKINLICARRFNRRLYLGVIDRGGEGVGHGMVSARVRRLAGPDVAAPAAILPRTGPIPSSPQGAPQSVLAGLLAKAIVMLVAVAPKLASRNAMISVRGRLEKDRTIPKSRRATPRRSWFAFKVA